MSVYVLSSVPVRGSYFTSLTSGGLTVVPPIATTTAINISQVSGLQNLLNSKLNDTLANIGNGAIVNVNGTDINLLSGMSTYGLTMADMQKLADVNTATAIELDYMAGVTSPAQAQLNARLPIDGSVSMTGSLKMAGNAIQLSPDNLTSMYSSINGIINFDIAGINEVRLDTAGLHMAADGTNRLITGVLDPATAQDAATKNYVDTIVSAGTYLPITGGTMTGNIAMNGRIVVLSPDGISNIKSVTNNVVTITVGTVICTVNATGWDFGAVKLTNIASPTVGADVGDRTYNDGRYAQLTNNLSDIANAATARSNLGLAIVANTGSYTDLSNLPILPATIGSLTDVTTGITGAATDKFVIGWNNVNAQFELFAQNNISTFGRVGVVVAANGDYNASQITNTPSGNISSVTVQSALSELDVEKLAINGSIPMTGNLDMGGNTLINFGATFNIGSHVFNATTYTSALGGNSQLISLSATPSATAPTYSFASDATSGIWYNGADIAMSIAGVNKFAVNATRVSAANLPVQDVASPTLLTDAATKGYVDGLISTRVLGSVAGVDLTIAGNTSIYTVPIGKSHIISHVILVATSYSAGAAPVAPQITVGTSLLNSSIIAATPVNMGLTGAADMAYYYSPQNGSSTPNATENVTISVPTPAAGTISAMVVTAYIIGYEV